MINKVTVFYRGNKQINFDFKAEEISSDGAVLFEKLERKHKIINYFSNLIPDLRDSSRIIDVVTEPLWIGNPYVELRMKFV